jgi:hypothetical protein
MTVARTDSDSLDVVQQCKWKPLDSGGEVKNDDSKAWKKPIGSVLMALQTVLWRKCSSPSYMIFTTTTTTTTTTTNNNNNKARNQGITKNSPIGHCTLSSESTNVKVHNVVDIRNNITCSTNKEQLHTIYPRNMVCFRYIAINTLHKGDKYNNNNNNNVIIKLLSSSFFLYVTHSIPSTGGLHITTRHTLWTVTALWQKRCADRLMAAALTPRGRCVAIMRMWTVNTLLWQWRVATDTQFTS